MKILERVSLRINDDESVTINIEPCSMERDDDEEKGHYGYEGELTATAKNFEEALTKVREMLSLKSKKGTKPKNVLSEYLKA